ncbi:MAG: gliding motility-associated ABC transporter substrate-binding protein GldG [Bacteroidia bacterium]|nr:gliding motility-associated ABC transporter substrate-binding protein GldG [Bacteroidia bacterium]
MMIIKEIFGHRTFWWTVIVLLVLNYLAAQMNWRIDFTEDKRFSISKNTTKVLKTLEQPVYAEILFGGDFQAGPKRLQEATVNMLSQFQNINSRIRYDLVDPLEGPPEDVAARQRKMAASGITYTSFTLPDDEQVTQRIAYPYVVFYQGEYGVPIEILEEQSFGDGEAAINESIALLEFKFSSALQRLSKGRKPLIYFTEGHDELIPLETIEYEKSVRHFFQTGRIHLDSTEQIDQKIDVLVVAKPMKPFSESDLYKIDQYLMQGGKIVWMIDQLAVQLDSLRGRASYLPPIIELGLDELFFKYAIRLNKSLVVDTECTRIPLVVASQGGRPKQELFPYYYHPVPDPRDGHIIGTRLDRVNLWYAGSIDTLRTKFDQKRTVLLKSSMNSFEQQHPVNLDFEIQKIQTEFDRFDDGNKILGLLVEGKFPSFFANRPAPIPNANPKAESQETAMVVISDGDLIRNRFDQGQDGRPVPMPIGFNRFENYKFDNEAFFGNIISYLLGESDLLEARKKNVELRLLNQAKIKSEKSFWQLLNVVLPLLLLAIFGLVNSYIRKRKYAK